MESLADIPLILEVILQHNDSIRLGYLTFVHILKQTVHYVFASL